MPKEAIFYISPENRNLGSGKTYTMIGTKEKPGLMTLLTQSLYEKINPQEYTVLLSYLVWFK